MLESQCQYYLNNSLAASTHRTYSSAQRKYILFCRENDIYPPLPATERVLCLFITKLAQSIQSSSIQVYLSAVRSLHLLHGFTDPMADCQRLHHVLRGIKRVQGPVSYKRLPITDDLMHIIFGSLTVNNPDHEMFWAACTLAYFGFLRAAEFTVPNADVFNPQLHLQLSDLSFDSHDHPTCLRVHLKTSKTDPFRQGCDIHIGQGSSTLCAVHAMAKYLHHRGSNPGPLFLFANGQTLSRHRLSTWLQNIFSNAKLPGQFNTHSFRIGAATVAARNGVPEHIIKKLGRWTSSAYMLYTRTSANSLAKVSRLLS